MAPDEFTSQPTDTVPWWLADELADAVGAQLQDAQFASSSPPQPDDRMLREWALNDGPGTALLASPRPDGELMAVIADDLAIMSRHDVKFPHDDDLDLSAGAENLLPTPEAIVEDLHGLAADLLVERLGRLDREDSARHAERLRTLTALVRAVGAVSPDPFRRLDAPTVAASEVAAELGLSSRTAKGMVHEALELDRAAWKPLMEAMSAGRLPQRRARVILDASIPVPPERLGSFAEQAVSLAAPVKEDGSADPDRIPSPGALGRRLRRLAEQHATEPLGVRKAKALEHRRVDIEPAGDSMAWLTAYLPLEVAATIDTRLEAHARALQSPDDPRTQPQRRLDAFTDLLTGQDGVGKGPAGGTRTEVIVTIPAATLTGQSDAPAEVLGYGPLDSESARLIAAHTTTWTPLKIHPLTGAPLAIGRTRYTPTASQRRYLGARDFTCRFPGCDRPAAATEADHTVEWNRGGETSTGNLALLCPEHHRLKSEGFWQARQIGQVEVQIGQVDAQSDALLNRGLHAAHCSTTSVGERTLGTEGTIGGARTIGTERTIGTAGGHGGKLRLGDQSNIRAGCAPHALPDTGPGWTSCGAPVGPPSDDPAIPAYDGPSTHYPPGTIEWTSPSGRRHITYPESHTPPPF